MVRSVRCPDLEGTGFRVCYFLSHVSRLDEGHDIYRRLRFPRGQRNRSALGTPIAKRGRAEKIKQGLADGACILQGADGGNHKRENAFVEFLREPFLRSLPVGAGSWSMPRRSSLRSGLCWTYTGKATSHTHEARRSSCSASVECTWRPMHLRRAPEHRQAKTPVMGGSKMYVLTATWCQEKPGVRLSPGGTLNT
jgi:hypothetical protein